MRNRDRLREGWHQRVVQKPTHISLIAQMSQNNGCESGRFVVDRI
jgi:hypothetical protein